MVESGLGKKSRGSFTIVAISYYFLPPEKKEQPFLPLSMHPIYII